MTPGPTGSTFRLEGAVEGKVLDQTVQLRLLAGSTLPTPPPAVTATALGAPVDAIAAGLAALPRIPGRFDLVEEGQDFAVVVDYAHTPDELGSVLAAARDLTRAGAGPEVSGGVVPPRPG